MATGPSPEYDPIAQVAVGALAVPADAPLHPWLGLVQRLVLAVWLPCIVVLARGLWHVATQRDR